MALQRKPGAILEARIAGIVSHAILVGAWVAALYLAANERVGGALACGCFALWFRFRGPK